MEILDHRILVHVLADEDELIETVPEMFVPSAFNVGLVVNKRAVADALAVWDGCPPDAGFVEARGTAGLAEVHRIDGPGSQPEQAFRADHAGGIFLVEIAPEPLGMEGFVAAEHKGTDAVLLGFGGMLAGQFFLPARRGFGFFHIKQACVQEGCHGYF